MPDETQRIRVSHVRGFHRVIETDIIAVWERDSLSSMIMGSSGPKDYFRNQIVAFFGVHAALKRVFLVRGKGVPFCIFQREDGAWFDAADCQLEVSFIGESR